MYIILSQKIDVESSYKDQPFVTYHYPARYRNAIHVGDSFIYSQGNRYDKSQRYYFGAGVVGSILKEDDNNYYTALLHCVKFTNKVPIVMETENTSSNSDTKKSVTFRLGKAPSVRFQRLLMITFWTKQEY